MSEGEKNWLRKLESTGETPKAIVMVAFQKAIRECASSYDLSEGDNMDIIERVETNMLVGTEDANSVADWRFIFEGSFRGIIGAYHFKLGDRLDDFIRDILAKMDNS